MKRLPPVNLNICKKVNLFNLKTKIMKTTILKISVFVLLFALMGAGCKPVPTSPGISIYKTQGDYYDLVTIGMKGDKIFRTYHLIDDQGRFNYTSNDTVYKRRARLINGYVLDTESSNEYDVFLSLTFKEYMRKETKYGYLPHDSVYKYIIDKNPYTEYYREKISEMSEGFSISDTAVINELIRKGELQKYFNREK